MIERELAEHDPRLAGLPRMLALSKADLVRPRSPRRPRTSGAGGVDVPVLVTSSATRQGLDELRARAARAACRWPSPRPRGGGRGRGGRVRRSSARPRAAAFEVTATGARRVPGRTGDAVERLIARHDLENEEALAHVEHRLRRMGVIAALERAGFEPGDDVEIGGDRRSSSIPARRSRLRAAMPVAVVKLGSSIVAEDGGELRLVGRRADLRGGRRAAPRRRRRGRGHLGRDRPRDAHARAAACARARSRSCRPRARSARAGSTAPTTSCCASAASSPRRCC